MLTHVDESGRAGMVDVSQKEATWRVARARSVVRLPEEVRELFREGDIQSKKGPVFHTAVIAGTMAVKKTSELIPFCHPLPIEKCAFEIDLNEQGDVVIECEVATHHRTGVEMEALTGASVAALTVYDMCKAVSHEIVIAETRLLSKTGGKREFRV
jgi:cyclic pyranopterin monophosphate synthase